MELREPTRTLSTRAPSYWRTTTALGLVPTLVAVWGAAVWLATGFLDDWAWLPYVGALAVTVTGLVQLTVAPAVRFRVHRWEITDIAVHVRSGWLTRTDEIVPLSRVQTVDSEQGPLQRTFGLRTVKVSTASSETDVSIDGLDDAVARDVVARLVAITAATPEDAT